MPQKAAMQKEAKRQAALKQEARKKAKEQAKAAKANGGWVQMLAAEQREPSPPPCSRCCRFLVCLQGMHACALDVM